MPQIAPLFAPLAAWRRRATSRLVHRAWGWLRQAGAVSADRPGPFRFGALGAGTRLAFPLGTIFGEHAIHIGPFCVIGEQVTLSAGMLPGQDLGPGSEPVLRLGGGVVLGRGSHVVAHQSISIGDDVFCGPYVYITDANHSYDDPDQPIGKQWPRCAPVEIGSGGWIGAGAVILPGARLGRNVVVAAGAVVRGEVPDHAVVAGAPARVVRRWDPEAGWVPPMRTPPPRSLPEGATWAELAALAEQERRGEAATWQEAAREAAGDALPPEARAHVARAREALAREPFAREPSGHEPQTQEPQTHELLAHEPLAHGAAAGAAALPGEARSERAQS
ncbi:acetyltransferase-like isoleucine patch superfamily enzyme [Allostreptomyces psammosilenae]|uniref:Acetyltransferase-like isoleucine patch superfamily enzyme n=1 Tax=Allostreptomyces psammosilenae TaxID=1892865 RepID=A0A853A1V7_9ACTN|nr:acetyltransferase-like isoleucine patch superfamily enzyme [Allostreptomyces psammosilenae]